MHENILYLLVSMTGAVLMIAKLIKNTFENFHIDIVVCMHGVYWVCLCMCVYACVCVYVCV